MIENLASLRAQLASQQPKSNSDFEADDPRALQRLSLEQQKKRAKELLRQWQTYPTELEKIPKLSDAQHAIAQENGFKNWSALKAHIDQIQLSHKAIKNGEPSALDAGQRVLHIRCGNDIQHALLVAGFVGDFLVFADPYAHGPVPETKTLEEFIRIRATYIGSDNNPPYEEALEHLTVNYADLESAKDYDAVYLWFEHDSYDQLIVAKLLDFFSDATKRPPAIKIINITHFPGVKRFNGIGQLPPVAMRILWNQFENVTAEQFVIGKQAWAAIRSSTPVRLLELIATGTPELPTMAIALDRHLKQLPSKRNGLNLTENLALQILNEKGEMSARRLFGWYTNHYEPLPFMGDTGFWRTLDSLASGPHPAIKLIEEGERPNQRQVSLTGTGKGLLAHNVDWLELNEVEYWVGGIHIDTRTNRVFRVDA